MKPRLAASSLLSTVFVFVFMVVFVAVFVCACAGRAPGARDDGIIDDGAGDDDDAGNGGDDDDDDDDDDDEVVDCSAFSSVARVLATDDAGFEAGGVAVIDDHVYWISRNNIGGDSRIMRTPRGGGDVEEVAAAGDNPGYFSQDGRLLVFADYVDGGDVVAIDTSVDPPAAVTVAPDRESPLFSAVDGANIYFGERTSIFRANVDDGSIALVFGDVDESAQLLTRDGEFLYWFGLSSGALLSRVSLADAAGAAKAPREVLAEVATPNAGNLVVAGDVFFFTDDFGRLIRHDLATGEENVFGASAFRATRDDERVYWSDPGNFDGTGSIRSRSIDASDDEVVHAASLPLPYTVAVDECGIYWVDLEDRTVRTVAK